MPGIHIFHCSGLLFAGLAFPASTGVSVPVNWCEMMRVGDLSSTAPALPLPAPGLGGVGPWEGSHLPLSSCSSPWHIPVFVPLHTCPHRMKGLHFVHKGSTLPGLFQFLCALPNLGVLQEYQEGKELSVVTKNSCLVLLRISWETNFHPLPPRSCPCPS